MGFLWDWVWLGVGRCCVGLNWRGCTFPKDHRLILERCDACMADSMWPSCCATALAHGLLAPFTQHEVLATRNYGLVLASALAFLGGEPLGDLAAATSISAKLVWRRLRQQHQGCFVPHGGFRYVHQLMLK